MKDRNGQHLKSIAPRHKRKGKVRTMCLTKKKTERMMEFAIILVTISIGFALSLYISGYLGSIRAEDFELVTKVGSTANNLYAQLVKYSSVAAGLALVIALLEMIVFQNDQKIDRAKSWAWRIVIVFVIINVIPSIINFGLSIAGKDSGSTITLS